MNHNKLPSKINIISRKTEIIRLGTGIASLYSIGIACCSSETSASTRVKIQYLYTVIFPCIYACMNSIHPTPNSWEMNDRRYIKNTQCCQLTSPVTTTSNNAKYQTDKIKIIPSSNYHFCWMSSSVICGHRVWSFDHRRRDLSTTELNNETLD